MKTIDTNWQKLKNEKRYYQTSDNKPVSLDAENFIVTKWYNNPKQYKLEYRIGVIRNTAWFNLDKHLGLWRETENRLYEEIQYHYRNESNLRLSRMTAIDELFEPIMNIKMIDVQRLDIKEDLINDRFFKNQTSCGAILIINGKTIYFADPTPIKDGFKYKFTL